MAGALSRSRPRTPTRSLCGAAALAAALALGAGPVGAGTAALEYREQALEVEGRPRTVTLPRGYRLEVLAEGLGGPRMATFGPGGDLFLGSRSGRVYRVPPPYARPEELVDAGDYPHSVAFRPGEILVARTDGVYRAPYPPPGGRLARAELELLARLPGGGGHTSRTVVVGPDGRVYVGLGISGNCSDQYLGPGYPFEDRRGGVLVLREGGGPPSWEPYATGLRNPVGLAWHPVTGELYATNNGPDHLGFERPPEHFSRLEPGSFHGMPWFRVEGGAVLRDPCAGSDPPRPAAEVARPAATFPARSAPLGVAFVPAGALGPDLEGDAVVALHGSWATAPGGGFFGDRATRRHPKLVAVRFGAGQARRVDDLVTGFQLEDGTRWARPAGVALGPDGALYFTSDQGAEALFRLRREP